MGFGIDCVFARLRSYEGLRPITHVIDMHARWESCSYLLLVLRNAKIVYIDDIYR